MGKKAKKSKKPSSSSDNVNNLKPDTKEKPSTKLNNSDSEVEEKSSTGNKRLAEESFDNSFSSQNDSDSRSRPRKEHQTKIDSYFESCNDSGSSRTDKGTNRSRSRDSSSDSRKKRRSKKKSHSRGRSSRDTSQKRRSHSHSRNSSSGSQKKRAYNDDKQSQRDNSRGRDSQEYEQDSLQDNWRRDSFSGSQKDQSYKNKYGYSNNSRGRDFQKFKQDNTSSNWGEKPSNYKSGKGAQDDGEFGAIMQSFKSTRKPEFIKVKEVECDLFDMADDYSLGHCVAEDMGMGAGIAVTFRSKFKKVEQLLNQGQPTGGLAILEDKDRFIYYLVTKKRSQGKPTIFSLFASLKLLREHIIQNKVTKLALPQIGCGLDRLNWDEVKYMLEFMFKNIEIEIVICIFRPVKSKSKKAKNLIPSLTPIRLFQNSDLPQVKNRSSKVVYERKLVRDIEQGTIIMYFTDTTGTITGEMQQLNEKFNFLLQFKNARKQLGTIITFAKDNYVLCGCVVKQKPEDSFNFGALHDCTVAIVRENRSKFKFYYVAFQAFASQQDEDITIKVLNIVKHNIVGMEIYVCYPPELAHEMPSSQGYGNNSFNSNYRSDNSANSNFNRSALNTSSTENTSGSYGPPRPSPGLRPEAREFNPAPQQSNYDAWDDKPVSSNTRNEVYQQTSSYSAREPAENWDDEEPVAAPPQLQGSRMVPDLSPTIYQDEYELFRHQEKISVEKITVMNERVNLASPGFLRIFFVTELIESIILPPFKGFPLHGEVLQQNKKMGEVAFAKVKENYYFVIVKRSLSDRMDERCLFFALTKLRSLVVESNAKNLAISNLKFLRSFPEMVKFVFRDQPEVGIYLYGQENNPPSPQPIKFSNRGLEMLRKKTFALYFPQDPENFPSILEAADKKFKLRDKFTKEKKTVGVVIEHEEVDERLLFGCIVTKNNKIDLAALHTCVAFVKKQAQEGQKGWNFVGFLAHPNAEINKKIVAILQNLMSDFEITIHCPGDLANAWSQK